MLASLSRSPCSNASMVWWTVARLLVGLGGAAPHHDEPVAVVLDPEALDVGDQLLGQVPLGVAGLDPDALEPRTHRWSKTASMATTPSSSAGHRCEVVVRSSTPAVRAASSAFGEIGSQPPNTMSSSDGQRHELADQRVAALARARRGGCGPSG